MTLLTRSAGCLFSVLAEAELCAIPTIQTLLQGIVNAHLNLALSLQEAASQEQHPKPQPSNQEESQDEYGQFDLNWDDPMVLAALDNATMPAVPVPVMMIQYTYQSLIEVRRPLLKQRAPLKLTTNEMIVYQECSSITCHFRDYHQFIREPATATAMTEWWRMCIVDSSHVYTNRNSPSPVLVSTHICSYYSFI